MLGGCKIKLEKKRVRGWSRHTYRYIIIVREYRVETRRSWRQPSIDCQPGQPTNLTPSSSSFTPRYSKRPLLSSWQGPRDPSINATPVWTNLFLLFFFLLRAVLFFTVFSCLIFSRLLASKGKIAPKPQGYSQ